MSEKLCALRKIGGGGTLKETTLWTNSAPTSNFGSQIVTISEPISNFDIIYCKYRASTSNDNTYITYWSESEFSGGNTSTPNSIVPVIGVYNSGTWTRRIYPQNDNVRIEDSLPIGATGARNQNTIPLEIGGIKL